ncbi:MAG: hypothetical protein ABSH36_01780 [Solirubrobacteraceae bacterium]
MSPSKKDKRRAKARETATSVSAASAATMWALAFYRTAEGGVPAREFLLSCPQPVREMLLAIVVAVRDAPPPSFPPSRMWHAMHGEMKGFHEARDEHDGHLYRLFCVVDSQAPEHGLDAKVVALVCGGVKRSRSAMGGGVYGDALGYRADYTATRRIALPVGVPESRRKT